MAILQNIRLVIEQRFKRWLAKRMPVNVTQTLTQRNVFIFPTKFGFAYLFFDLVLFLLATNYQNNLILLMSFLLGSLFITSMLNSFFNLSGLTISTLNKQEYLASTFVNQPKLFDFELQTRQVKIQLELMFLDNQHVNQASVNVQQVSADKTIVQVPFIANQRGKHRLPRLRIQSFYALGLFKTWTRLDFGLELLVFPESKVLHQPLLEQPQVSGADKVNA